jgi:predicted HicB family RNase H-like nuclease
MTDRMQHDGFIGSVHYSAKDETFFGKLEGVNDLITFEGTTVESLKKSFIAAVKDYKELCRQTGKESIKSFKGSFNVRISPEMHMQVFTRAKMEGKNLNEFVQEAIARELKRNP